MDLFKFLILGGDGCLGKAVDKMRDNLGRVPDIGSRAPCSSVSDCRMPG